MLKVLGIFAMTAVVLCTIHAHRNYEFIKNIRIAKDEVVLDVIKLDNIRRMNLGNVPHTPMRVLHR